jgi:exopolyphosphatase/guanosine-5'-triphosphate,3'-diphosphate pyrophosphatase
MSERRAIISLGTNTVRLLIVQDAQDGKVTQLEHRAVGTRLGEGLIERGMLADAAMERTLEAVRSFVEPVRANGAVLTCIATSAMRRAENAQTFAARFTEITGQPLRVIEGDEEAASSFRGATYDDAGDSRRIAVLDIGGGSTECAAGRKRRIERSVSLEVGTVRLTERFPELAGGAPGAPARNAAQRAHVLTSTLTSPLAGFGPIDELRAVAGTPATIGAIVSASDVEQVRGLFLSRDSIAGVRDRLLDAGLEERRKIPGMLAQRADVLAAGCIILLEALEHLGCAGARVETNDLLLGQLLAP